MDTRGRDFGALGRAHFYKIQPGAVEITDYWALIMGGSVSVIPRVRFTSRTRPRFPICDPQGHPRLVRAYDGKPRRPASVILASIPVLAGVDSAPLSRRRRLPVPLAPAYARPGYKTILMRKMKRDGRPFDASERASE